MSERHDPHGDDEQLRGLFARMREEDRAAVPPFPALEGRPAAAWSRAFVAVAGAAAVMAAVLFLLPSGPDPVDDGMLLAEWSAPSSDFLGLGELGVEFAVTGDEAPSPDTEDTLWMSLPTDAWIDQAEELFGPENER